MVFRAIAAQKVLVLSVQVGHGESDRAGVRFSLSHTVCALHTASKLHSSGDRNRGASGLRRTAAFLRLNRATDARSLLLPLPAPRSVPSRPRLCLLNLTCRPTPLSSPRTGGLKDGPAACPKAVPFRVVYPATAVALNAGNRPRAVSVRAPVSTIAVAIRESVKQTLLQEA